MPTIAEIIAAKKAKQAGTPAAAPAPTTAPKEPLAERVATKEAIDRIDPPGKQEQREVARKTAGLILNKDMPAKPESRGQRTPIAGPPEVPRDVIQPSNDQPMCIWIEQRTVWLCMPCEDTTMPPIKVLRLPWTAWPLPPADPLPEGDPF